MQQYIITEESIRQHETKLICCHVDESYHHRFVVGESYLLKRDNAVNYTYSLISETNTYAVTHDDILHCGIDGTAWVRFIPETLLTDEELFLMKLSRDISCLKLTS